MASPRLLLFGALLARAVSGAAPTALVTVAVLLPEHNLRRYPWAWPRVAPALQALELRLRPTGLAFRTAFLSCEDEEGTCAKEPAWNSLVKLKVTHSPDVLLGPGCDQASFWAGATASHWGLPFLTAGSLALPGRGPFNTTVYTGPAGPALGLFLARLHRHFGWTSRAAQLVREHKDPSFYHEDAVGEAAEQLREDAPNFAAHSSVYSLGHPEAAVQLIQASARVVHISGPIEMLHGFMHLAQNHNMTEGDYVFIYMDLFGESLRAEGHREAAKPWQSKESRDAGGLREAFQSVLVITAHEPQTPEYRRFQSELLRRAQRDFGVELKESLENLVAGCFHDGLLLYGMALAETRHEGGTKWDTHRILDKMRSRTFQGVTGTVIMNSDRIREGDFDLWSMADVESGEFQVVARYISSEKQIKWTGPIHWKKGGPPLDNPPCVFNMDDPSCGCKRELICCRAVQPFTSLSRLFARCTFSPGITEFFYHLDVSSFSGEAGSSPSVQKQKRLELGCSDPKQFSSPSAWGWWQGADLLPSSSAIQEPLKILCQARVRIFRQQRAIISVSHIPVRVLPPSEKLFSHKNKHSVN